MERFQLALQMAPTANRTGIDRLSHGEIIRIAGAIDLVIVEAGVVPLQTAMIEHAANLVFLVRG